MPDRIINVSQQVDRDKWEQSPYWREQERLKRKAHTEKKRRARKDSK